MSELPSEFDVIVVGTGMAESIFAAAASRIGKNVLHIDSNGYYGGQWASFNLESIQELTSTPPNKSTKKDKLTFGNEIFNLKDFICKFHRTNYGKNINDGSENSDATNTKQAEDENECKNLSIEENLSEEINSENIGKSIVDQKLPKRIEINQDYLKEHSRKFNIDLAPKLHYARGELVNLLVSANIARYSEYRSVGRVLTWLNDALEEVPCSRSDVFANNKVSVIEKRMLMKLFTSLDEITDDLSMEKKTFRSYLKEKKLSNNLIHYVLYAISMSDNEVSCKQGIQNTKRFLSSLGRFGRTPFLFSMYGSGELGQGFCRVCAVYGGTYALNQPLSHINMDEKLEQKFKSIVVNEQEINASHLVLSIDKTPQQFLEKYLLNGPKINYISRAIFITDKSVKNHTNKDPYITLIIYPPEHKNNLTIILELGKYTGTCADNTYLVHMIAKGCKSAEEDFKECVKNLFHNEAEVTEENSLKPKILWSCYFSIPYMENCSDNCDIKIGENIFLCSGPDFDLDYDNAINEAKNIFQQIYPDCEFLPKCPDPEDIIIEGYTEDIDKIENSNEEVTLANEKNYGSKSEEKNNINSVKPNEKQDNMNSDKQNKQDHHGPYLWILRTAGIKPNIARNFCCCWSF